MKLRIHRNFSVIFRENCWNVPNGASLHIFLSRLFYIKMREKAKKQIIFAKIAERAMDCFETKRSENFGEAGSGKLTIFEVALIFAKISLENSSKRV